MYILVTVAAAQCAVLLVNYIKHGLHGLVVGDAFGVAAFYYAANLTWHGDHLLLNHLIVADYVQDYVGCYH